MLRGTGEGWLYFGSNLLNKPFPLPAVELLPEGSEGTVQHQLVWADHEALLRAEILSQWSCPHRDGLFFLWREPEQELCVGVRNRRKGQSIPSWLGSLWSCRWWGGNDHPWSCGTSTVRSRKTGVYLLLPGGSPQATWWPEYSRKYPLTGWSSSKTWGPAAEGGVPLSGSCTRRWKLWECRIPIPSPGG